MRDNGLALALFALVMGGAVALAIAGDISGPACAAAKTQLAGSKDFDFGCLEYWINRYQSLLGSTLTAGIAAATLLWIARQLKAADRQAAAAAADALYRRVEELTLERRAIQRGQFEAARLAQSLARDVRAGMNHAEVPNAMAQLANCFRQLQETASDLDETVLANPRSRLVLERRGYIEHLRSMAGDVGVIQRELHGMLSDPSRLSGKHWEKVVGLKNRIYERAETTPIDAIDLTLKIETELTSVWIRIREFQSSAMHV